MTAHTDSTKTNQLILFQLQQLPETRKQEVLDFIGYLFSKHQIGKTPTKKNRPQFGRTKGKYRMAEDFDAPLEIFKDYME